MSKKIKAGKKSGAKRGKRVTPPPGSDIHMEAHQLKKGSKFYTFEQKNGTYHPNVVVAAAARSRRCKTVQLMCQHPDYPSSTYEIVLPMHHSVRMVMPA